jgi:chemosensory pili system protein ChpA (sensor histidine kinase/response regulator)
MREMQDALMGLRMVPAAALAQRLQRAVRVTAKATGKLAELLVEGEELELDKTMLEEMSGPLLHLVRNAVDHGIEAPDARRAAGKPTSGQVHFRTYRSGTEVVLQVRDDGAGLDPEKLRTAALRQGRVTEAEAARLAPEELQALVFLPGFSTAGQLSEISGRGIGMDVVRSAVHERGGSVSVSAVPGQGTTVTVRLPLTMALSRMLLVAAQGEVYALPLAAVRHVAWLDRQELPSVGRDTAVRVEGQTYPMLWLAQWLGLPPVSTDTRRGMPILVLEAAGRSFALGIDRVVEARDVVVKSLGHHLRRVPGIGGATLTGDGRVVLILEPRELIAVPAPGRLAGPAGRGPDEAAQAGLDVLVVDDSMSVRRVVANVLRGAGLNPIEAKDGLDALEILRGLARLPDLVLLDIEMPRMDGYELLWAMRAAPAYRALPVVMLTSRSGQKHRQKALDLGASAYLCKPFRDDELLAEIRRHVPAAVGSAS